MSVKCFAQFLLERAEIDEGHLREALDLMESKNKTIGELAVAAGYASADEARRVNGEQRRLDLPYGELAVRMGVLNSVELEEVALLQHTTRIQIQDALVQLGHVAEDSIGRLLDEFKKDQAPYANKEAHLPSELAKSRVASRLVDLFPRFCRRMGRIETKMTVCADPDSMIEHVLVASIVIVGTDTVKMTLAVDHTFGERMAVGISGFDDPELARELAADAVGEFLNILAGNVVGALAAEGMVCRLEAPQFGVLPTEGYRFDLASDFGFAVLVIDVQNNNAAPS
jgi:CheY-specific phosphatase CheX